jgi:hypothetical protein
MAPADQSCAASYFERLVISPWNHNLHPRLEHNALLSFLRIYDPNVCYLFDLSKAVLMPYFQVPVSHLVTIYLHTPTGMYLTYIPRQSIILRQYIYPTFTPSR